MHTVSSLFYVSLVMSLLIRIAWRPLKRLRMAPKTPPSRQTAFDAIARQCEELMAMRRGTHAAELRRSVARSGLRLPLATELPA